MALELDFTDESGIDFAGTYWKVSRCDINFLREQVHIWLTGYKSKWYADRDDEYRPIRREQVTLEALQAEGLDVTFDDAVKFIQDNGLLPAAYWAAKQLGFFEGATDV